jgi:hypothetical protein
MLGNLTHLFTKVYGRDLPIRDLEGAFGFERALLTTIFSNILNQILFLFSFLFIYTDNSIMNPRKGDRYASDFFTSS